LEIHAGITYDQNNNKLEKLLKKRFYHVLKQSQKTNTDLFGFGKYFRHQILYDDLKNWREKYYPNVKANFQVQVSSE
jgi:spore germination protein KC